MLQQSLDCLNRVVNPESVAFDDAVLVYLQALQTPTGLDTLTTEEGKRLVGLLQSVEFTAGDQLFKRNGCLCHVSSDHKVTAFEGSRCIAKGIQHEGDLKGFVLPGDKLGEMKQSGRVHSVAYSADGTEILTACADSIVRRWDRYTGESLGELTHDREVFSLSYSPDG